MSLPDRQSSAHGVGMTVDNAQVFQRVPPIMGSRGCRDGSDPSMRSVCAPSSGRPGRSNRPADSPPRTGSSGPEMRTGGTCKRGVTDCKNSAIRRISRLARSMLTRRQSLLFTDRRYTLGGHRTFASDGLLVAEPPHCALCSGLMHRMNLLRVKLIRCCLRRCRVGACWTRSPTCSRLLHSRQNP